MKKILVLAVAIMLVASYGVFADTNVATDWSTPVFIDS